MELITTPKIENVRMLDRYNTRKSSAGTLYLTATYLIFVDPDNKKETWILLMQIASVEKLSLTAAGSPLLIRCKTFLSVTFIIPRERECYEVYTALQQLSQPVHVEDLYCFRFTSSSEDIPKNAGWNFFDLQAEYQRMSAPNNHWSLTLLNKNYELCDTYPKYLYVPSTASISILLGSSKFRSKGRLPVLSYLHRNKAAICRCSQPLSGFSARCLEDEQMLECVLRTNTNATYMYVVDTRPRINAMANRATGKGYESENFYENIKFQFLGIENIHVMRNSLMKLLETCELKSPTMSAFLTGLETCGWLKHIKSILDTSFFIAKAVESGVNVVVHCSDGWDRTAQVISLASLLLDPYYRTVQGFQALVEKDWLSFGHKFTDRTGHLAGDPKEVSPIFTQFIDCTWQLIQLFPAAFQLNERFLITLHDHLSSCQFGTFIGNCDKDRIDLRLSERTFSLWGYMANHMKEYINPLYNPVKTSDVIQLKLLPQNIRFWRGMYCRFESGIHPRENIDELLLATRDHSNSLEDHLKLLRKAEEMSKSFCLKSSPSKRSKDRMLQEFGVSPDTGSENAFLNLFTEDIDSIALDWKTFRNIKECACTTPFDHFSKKYHCWQCGDIFCTRCMDRHIPLPGYLSQCAVPVCRLCYHKISQSSSLGTP